MAKNEKIIKKKQSFLKLSLKKCKNKDKEKEQQKGKQAGAELCQAQSSFS